LPRTEKIRKSSLYFEASRLILSIWNLSAWRCGQRLFGRGAVDWFHRSQRIGDQSPLVLCVRAREGRAMRHPVPLNPRIPVRPCLLRYSRRFSLALANWTASGARSCKASAAGTCLEANRATNARKTSRAVVSERSPLPCSESDRIAAQQQNDAKGHKQTTSSECSMSAVPPIADVDWLFGNVR
jgi:hypothetical protein